MRILYLPKALEASGITTIIHDGWETRGSEPFNPKVIIAHHTAINDEAASVRICINGRPDLSGPLAHVVLGKTGRVHCIASGKANHAGPGGWRGYSGNSSALGIEAVHVGDQTTPWPQVQLDAYYKICAVMVKMVGGTEDMVCGHKEYAQPPGRKIDPAQLDMNKFRENVKLELTKLKTSTGVKPMYEPALQLEPIVAHLQAPSGGVWLLTGSGAIYSFGAPFYGAANGKPYFAGRTAAKLIASGDRYQIVAESGERYGPVF